MVHKSTALFGWVSTRTNTNVRWRRTAERLYEITLGHLHIRKVPMRPNQPQLCNRAPTVAVDGQPAPMTPVAPSVVVQYVSALQQTISRLLDTSRLRDHP